MMVCGVLINVIGSLVMCVPLIWMGLVDMGKVWSQTQSYLNYYHLSYQQCFFFYFYHPSWLFLLNFRLHQKNLPLFLTAFAVGLASLFLITFFFYQY